MGLAMMRETVGSLGGLITATSRQGQRGFNFTLTLPLDGARA